MAIDSVLTKLEDNVLTITLNRPDKLNAMTVEMMREISDIFIAANANDEIRCIVVTAAGDYFCAGTDLSGGGPAGNANRVGPAWLSQKQLDIDEINRESVDTKLPMSIYGCYKPVIGAINGPGVGIGSTMLLPMDFRIASDTAKFGFPFTRRGFVPEAGSSWFLPRIVSPTKAMDWLITGRMIDAKEAQESGLLTSVHKPEDVLPAAYAIAREIVTKTSSLSVAYTRQLAWRGLASSEPDETMALEIALFMHSLLGADGKEGVQSFLEKRLPNFPGKLSKDTPPFFPWW